MSKISINIRHVSRCAFCKYWYDPMNLHINPIAPAGGLWQYDSSAKCKCLRDNSPRPAGSSCRYYERKV